MKSPSGKMPTHAPSRDPNSSNEPLSVPYRELPKNPDMSVNQRPSFKTKSPSNNKNKINYSDVDDDLDYTIDKNPEMFMHQPQFAETFKQPSLPESPRSLKKEKDRSSKYDVRSSYRHDDDEPEIPKKVEELATI